MKSKFNLFVIPFQSFLLPDMGRLFRRMPVLLLFIVSLVLVSSMSVNAQQVAVKGTVKDQKGEMLVGVTVVVKGTNSAVITDVDGNYSLSGVSSNANLVFSFMGLTTQEIPVNGRSRIDVVMEETTVGLDEVVVTALGIRREKKALGYSVQEINSESINEVKPTNVVSALSGKIAGVQVTNSTGAVGSSARLIIRGNHSFGNNEPLWIVDGTPFSNFASDMSAWGGQDYGNGALDLDPSNIESLTVLKGANAAALYGSRAANGVVVVTTKRGSKSKNKLGIDVVSGVTLDRVSIFPDWQNRYGGGMYGSEYDWEVKKTALGTPNLSYQDFAKKYSYNYVNGWGGGVSDGVPRSYGPRLDVGLMLDQFTGKNQPWVSRPDNQKDFFETGVNIDNSVAISKSFDAGSIRVFLSNNDITGTLYNTDLTKNTASISGDVKLSKRWSASSNFTYVNNHSNNLASQGYDGGGDNPAATFAFFQRQVDVAPLKENWKKIDEFGHTYSYALGEMDNPYLSLNNNASRTRNRFYGNAAVNFVAADWITLTGRIGTDYYTEMRKKIKLGQTNEGNGTGNFWQTLAYAQETNADFLASMNKKIGEDWVIDGNIGANYRLEEMHSVRLAATNLTVPDFFTIGNVSGNPEVSQYDSKKVTNSLLGSFNMAYKNYLFLGVTGRNDWSSTLPKDNWSYFYPSVSLGFVFTDAFNIDPGVLPFGKIRASWAQVGNDTSPYQIAAAYNSIGSPWNGVSLFELPGTMPPAALKPEIANSVEAGIELRMLDDRLRLDVSVYDLKTRNQIMPVNIAGSTGYSSILINAGEIENKGIEIVLSADIIKSDAFNWDVTINWAKNQNSVTELYNDLESLWISDMWDSYIEARPGEPYGVIKGKKWLRNAAGELVITSAGLTQNAPNYEVLGNITPDWIGGIQNNFSYKKFTLGVMVDGRMGGDVVSGTKFWGTRMGNTAITLINPFTGEDNIREVGIVVPGVLANGTPNTKRVSAQDFFNNYPRAYEHNIIDGSFIKLRELSVGYVLPTKAMNKMGINSARLSFVCRNVAMLYTHKSNDVHIDPETGFGTGNSGVGYEQMQIPSARSYGFKLALSF